MAIRETVDVLKEEKIQEVVQSLEGAETVFIWCRSFFSCGGRHRAEMVTGRKTDHL